MSDIVKLAERFEYWAGQSLEALAKAKAKAKKKRDPKAAVRNRGTVCVPASSAKDKKDHFPLNSLNQARNALSRAGQYSKVPSWYNGSLESLKSLISRKVHSKYPSIKINKKKSKK
jgi:hypothetical protein